MTLAEIISSIWLGQLVKTVRAASQVSGDWARTVSLSANRDGRNVTCQAPSTAPSSE